MKRTHARRFDTRLSGDGVVSAVDALQVINGIQNGSDQSNSDVNQDGVVSAGDALVIINAIADGRGEGSETSAILNSSSSAPSATVSHPSEIRERDIFEISVGALIDITVAEINELQIDWGDGRITNIPNEKIALPLTRYQRFFGDPATMTVEVSAVTATQVISLVQPTLTLSPIHRRLSIGREMVFQRRSTATQILLVRFCSNESIQRSRSILPTMAPTQG